ncbi:MAG: DUF86 domain-containing protein [Aquificaceae bacterium]|nr:DUF86 domain-containing protein [Aquificaceae bacterium]
MSKRSWKLFINDILESIQKIEKYTDNLSYNEFVADEKTKDAVIRNLEIIGEAARQIPDNIKALTSEIEWSKIIGLRNRIIHGYFAIEYEIIWQIVKKELPSLKTEIQKILKEEK